MLQPFVKTDHAMSLDEYHENGDFRVTIRCGAELRSHAASQLTPRRGKIDERSVHQPPTSSRPGMFFARIFDLVAASVT